MKKKLSRMLGVGLTIALITSLMVAAAPASAGALSLGAEKDIPKTEEFFLSNVDDDIVDMAVSGDTVYIAVTNSATANVTYKSTDGGATWTSLVTSTGYPTTKVPKLVSVSPSDANVVAMVTTDNYVYYSSNGGSKWSSMGQTATPNVTTINSIDVSPSAGGYYYLAAGGNASGNMKLYVLKVDVAQTWADRSATAGVGAAMTDVQAIKFSPNYPIDKIITVVSGNTTGTYLQVWWGENAKWNAQITGFETGYPVQITTTVTSATLAAASLALPSTYIGSDEAERIVFVGVAAASVGGVWRITDTYAKAAKTWSDGDEGPIGSIAYHDSGKLLAGDYDANQVYRCLSPMASTPKFEKLNTLKKPGGASKTLVAWSGDTAVAATSGDESAFAESADDGYAFNDISMVDTTLATMADVATSADGKTVYLATYSGNDISIWLKASSWKRVLSLKDQTTTAPLVRVAPEDATAVYVANMGTQSVWVSKNSGTETWKSVPCYKLTVVQDFIVESVDVVHAIDNVGGTSRTATAGASWRGKKTTAGVVPYMIALAPDNTVLVGGSGGYVAFSTDSGGTWEKTKDAGTGNAFVVADADFADNNIIYVGIGTKVMKGKADTTTDWGARGALTATATDGNVSVVGSGRYESVYYFLTSSSNTTYSDLWRALNLQKGASVAQCLWSSLNTTKYTFAATPQALTISSGPKLWGVDSAGTAELISCADSIATTAPAVSSPADGYTVPLNPGTGKAYNVTFTFARQHATKVTSLDIQIATDSAFSGVVYEKSFDVTTSTSQTIAKVIGPSGTTNQISDYMPGETYYWRVRTSSTGPMYSPWSAARSFTIEGLEVVVVFDMLSPEAGAMNVPVMPTFVWTEIEGAAGYEIIVAEDPTFAIIDFSHTSDRPFFKSQESLAYGATYYWKVRAVGGEWVTGIFTTMEKPAEVAPPVVIEPTPPPEVQIVEVPISQPTPIPSFMLWMIIGIGAILVIALIVLIVRTRRVV